MIIVRIIASSTAIWLAILGCAGGGASDRQAGSNPPAAAVVQPTPDPLLGTWRLVADPPPRGRLGQRITLVIDSVAGDSAFGKLQTMFSGNVGIDPSKFGPLRGRRSDSTVALHVPAADPGGPQLAFEGLLGSDTIRLRSLRIGEDEMTGPAADLLLVRTQ
jgi:hypothetical protein